MNSPAKTSMAKWKLQFGRKSHKKLLRKREQFLWVKSCLNNRKQINKAKKNTITSLSIWMRRQKLMRHCLLVGTLPTLTGNLINTYQIVNFTIVNLKFDLWWSKKQKLTYLKGSDHSDFVFDSYQKALIFIFFINTIIFK